MQEELVKKELIKSRLQADQDIRNNKLKALEFKAALARTSCSPLRSAVAANTNMNSSDNIDNRSSPSTEQHRPVVTKNNKTNSKNTKVAVKDHHRGSKEAIAMKQQNSHQVESVAKSPHDVAEEVISCILHDNF